MKANTATITWTAPTTNVDGTELTALAGFRIYHGTSSGSYSGPVTLPANNALCRQDEGVTECTYTVKGLRSGVHYFRVTAYDEFGHESDYSNEVSKAID